MAHVDPAEWHPYYMQCLQYFVEHGQNTSGVQALAAFLNIRLPYQRASTTTSLRLYIRRLIVTAHDSPDTLCAFFGDHWDAGIGPIRDQERINYLFTAKSSGWAETKTSYDILPDEHTPFLRPLREPLEEEIRTAEARWSEWLAMEDWMLGPRSPW
ncbi:hypothetical protein ASPZODRAFT_62511 [Penicilliopsis zonata CBS 506.65]|uniref:Uncharacterized protein n=1 Tax=Penicilliopsis zonata CBS 506.65 TaxID=1073090 RepID=A0A1L9SLT0_9EURO|nr:hypothetical protein ASPZODRAFT_62511 [Penicilliopsis zonata CBS 506.65]OJJ48175.1 hypothetical protein ASPZODRAFT_62511 [Penicilliopsis zonata CBS 506.65]